ncbi:MAG: hypothetical protein WAM44_20985 [Chthoniobacterales bacterium]
MALENSPGLQPWETVIPWFGKLPESFDRAVARPSNVLGANYNRLSYLVSHEVDRFLRRNETAEETVREIAAGAQKMIWEGE